MAIHPTAVIDRHAELDSSVEVGPYAIIDGPVKIAAGTRLYAHAYVSGWTEIGQRCELHPFSVVGHPPQDVKYKGERSYCRIGNEVIIREGATVHRGTVSESATTIGDRCFIGTQSHVAHNCTLAAQVMILNFSATAGHVEIHNRAIVSAGVGIHQFVRIGELAYVAGHTRVAMDVPPFMMCQGDSKVIQHNVVGLRRAGYDRETLAELRKAYHILYRSGWVFQKAVNHLAEIVRTEPARKLVDFLQSESRRGFCGGTKRYKTGDDASGIIE